MADSNITGADRLQPRPPGHGTSDLGPSDTSDSGSDIAGASGSAEDAGMAGADSGTTSDMERSRDIGPDLGDSDLDSDTDSTGTGERKAAGRDARVEDASDVGPDRITRDPGGLTFGEDPEGIGVSRDSGKR